MLVLWLFRFGGGQQTIRLLLLKREFTAHSSQEEGTGYNSGGKDTQGSTRVGQETEQGENMSKCFYCGFCGKEGGRHKLRVGHIESVFRL